MSLQRRAIKAPSPADRDGSGGFRWASAVAGVLTAGLAAGAAADRRMGRLRRTAIAGSASAVALWAARAFREPHRMGEIVIDHPHRMVLAGAAPVVLAPAFGRHFNFMHMASVGGAGFTAAASDPSRRHVIGGAAAGWWLTSLAARTSDWRAVPHHPMAVVDWFVMPAAVFAAASLTPHVRVASRELGLLRDKLDLAERQVGAMEAYRQSVSAALGRLEAGLQSARHALDAVEDPDQRDRLRDLVIRSTGRLQERGAIIDAAARRSADLSRFLRWRLDPIAACAKAPLVVDIDVDPAVQISDPYVLGMIGGVAAGAISNALRHSEPTRFEAVLTPAAGDSSRFVLTFRNDGVRLGAVPPKDGRGLSNIRTRVLEVSDVEPTWGVTEAGGWEVRVEAPTNRVLQAATLTSPEMVSLMERTVSHVLWINSAMALMVALDGKQLVPGTRGRSRVMAVVILGAFAGLELARSRSASGHHWTAAYEGLLWLAAAASASSPYIKNSIYSGWASAAVGRTGLRIPAWRLGALAVAHSAATWHAYGGPPANKVPALAEQVTTTALGPLTVFGALRSTLPRLDTDERRLQKLLGEVADLHDLAEAFHSSHPATATAKELQARMTDIDPGSAAELDGALSDLRSAAGTLPEGHTAFEFADQFAEALSRRIYPATVSLRRDDANLAALQNEAVVRAEFRREALTVADRLGDHLTASFPPNWQGTSDLVETDLLVTADPSTDTLLIYATPRSRAGDLVPETAHVLASALSDVGGSLRDGSPVGRIRLTLPLQRRRTEWIKPRTR